MAVSCYGDVGLAGRGEHCWNGVVAAVGFAVDDV